MPVLITCKFDDDWIHSNWDKLETPFSPFKVNGNAQGLVSVVKSPIQPKFELTRDFMPVLDTCILTKIQLNVTEKTRRRRFPHYMSMGAFGCHGNHSFDHICFKHNAAFPPLQWYYWLTIWLKSGLGDICVRKCGQRLMTTTDDRIRSLAIL